MVNIKYKQLSENEQMYLVSMAKLQEEGQEGPIALSLLADALSVLPVSVNQMVRKMEEEGLVYYYPYKGVEFSDAGQQLVRRILRYRRLWEVFLVKELGMSLEEADAQACRMEHITSEEVASRLSAFLGDPCVCLHGHPIPALDGDPEETASLPLDQLEVGAKGYVYKVQGEEATHAFLSDEGIKPGVPITRLATGNDGAVLLETGHRRVYLAESVAQSIFIQVDQTSIK
ncbi:MAG: metal-dependent transcriptional regulator [Anaerolineales bacterium]